MQNNRSFCAIGLSTVFWILVCVIWTFGAITSVARAYCRLTTDSDQPGECSETGIPLYWECSNIEYAVCPRENHDLSFDVVLDAIDTSFQSWEDVECDGEPLGFEFVRHDDPKDCDLHYLLKNDPDHDFSPNENLIVFVQDWEDFDDYKPDAFALTSVWHNTKTGEILGFDMELNETIGELGVCGVSPRRCQNVADIQNVVTHEIGHVLGLGHTDLKDAVMFDKSNSGDMQMRILKDDDIEGICAVYVDEPLSYCSNAKQYRSTCSVGRVDASNNAAVWYFLVLGLIAFLPIYRKFA